MHKIMNVSLLLFTLSLSNSLTSCQKYIIIFNIKQITQSPPRENRIMQVVERSNFFGSDLGFKYAQISSIARRMDTGTTRVDLCDSYYKMFLNQEQREYIKKNMREKRNFYIEAQQKNSQNRQWFKIQHVGIVDYTESK